VFLEQLIEQARGAVLDPTAADLVRLLLGVLLVEAGPPPKPLAGISGEPRMALLRTPKGRPWFVARAWDTPPWHCLEIGEPSIPWRRPFTLHRPQEAPRAIADGRSMRFQRKIAAAVRALGLPKVNEGAVHAAFSVDRTFLAYRRTEAQECLEPLRGDADNYIKNVLDGLQMSRAIPNDRGVLHLVASKTPLPPTDLPTLDEALSAEARTAAEDGEALDDIRKRLGLTHRQMAMAFSQYEVPTHRRSARPQMTPEEAAGAFLAGSHTLRRARPSPGPARDVFDMLVAKAMRAQVLKMTPTTAPARVARQLRIDLRTLRRWFVSDEEITVALSRHRVKASGSDRAVGDVLSGKLTPTVAAAAYGVPVSTLKNKLARLKKRAAASPAKSDAAEPTD
jgi:Holliday junction resolvase RusA-like endonuclease